MLVRTPRLTYAAILFAAAILIGLAVPIVIAFPHLGTVLGHHPVATLPPVSSPFSVLP